MGIKWRYAPGCTCCGGNAMSCEVTCPSGSATAKSIVVSGVTDGGLCVLCTNLNTTWAVTFLDTDVPQLTTYGGRTLESSCHWRSGLVVTCVIGGLQQTFDLHCYIVKFTNGDYALVVEPHLGLTTQAAFVTFYGASTPCGSLTSEAVTFQSEVGTLCVWSAASVAVTSA